MPKSFTNNLPRDGSSGVIQTGGSFMTKDATASPVTSPATLSGGINVLAVPQNAAELILLPVTHDMKISEIAGMTQYDLVSMGTKEVYGCAGMTSVYVQGTVGDTLYFRFNMLGPVTE